MLLTPREKRLLRRFAQGRTDRSIARELCEPVERIAVQRERLLEKLQIRSMDHLTEAAVRLAFPPIRTIDPSQRSLLGEARPAHQGIVSGQGVHLAHLSLGTACSRRPNSLAEFMARDNWLFLISIAWILALLSTFVLILIT